MHRYTGRDLEVVMRIFLSIVGILAVLVGIVWILQGFNILLGSMMSGHLQYAVWGLGAAVVGILLLVYANRRPRDVPGSNRTRLDR
jgi:hypothetical protein